MMLVLSNHRYSLSHSYCCFESYIDVERVPIRSNYITRVIVKAASQSQILKSQGIFLNRPVCTFKLFDPERYFAINNLSNSRHAFCLYRRGEIIWGLIR